MVSNISRLQKGFTLVELVVVIVILGIISAVAAPRFFDIQSYKERGFSDELISALRYAQKKAVASGCDIRVEVTSTGFSVYRHTASSSCGTLPPATTIIADPSGEPYIGQSPLALNPATVVFDALGRLRDSGYLLLSTPLLITDTQSPPGINIKIWPETGCVEGL